MATTYLATLKDNFLEWQSESPSQLAKNQSFAVSVTILEAHGSLETMDRGWMMATALEKLAMRATNIILQDAAKWERNIREDRSLPGRDA